LKTTIGASVGSALSIGFVAFITYKIRQRYYANQGTVAPALTEKEKKARNLAFVDKFEAGVEMRME
jgi:hypothetical protein